MKYDEPKAGEWVRPRRKGYRLACCDCGLVHRLNFRLVAASGKGRFIQFQVFRDNRATGQMRRYLEKRCRLSEK